MGEQQQLVSRSPALSRSRLRAAVVVLVAVGLVAGAAGGVWWWTHPRVLVSGILSDTGGLVGAEVAPGEEQYVLLAEVDPGGRGEVLQFSDSQIEARAVAPAGAGEAPSFDAVVIVCRNDPTSDESVGSGDVEDMREACRDLRPLLPGERVDGRAQLDSLFVRMVVDAPGRVRLDGVTLTYRRDGFLAQRGSQRIGAALTVRAGDY